MPSQGELQRQFEQHEMTSGLKARLAALDLTGPKLVKEYRENLAQAILAAGMTVIPLGSLQDHQIVVSRGVYDAAKQALEHGAVPPMHHPKDGPWVRY